MYQVKLYYGYEEHESGFFHAFCAVNPEEQVDEFAMQQKLAQQLDCDSEDIDEGRFDYKWMYVDLPTELIAKIKVEGVKEYLQEHGMAQKEQPQQLTATIHSLSIVNSEGYANGKESKVLSFASLEEFIDNTYPVYVDTMEECIECNILDDAENTPILSKEAFQKELTETGYLCIQCLDSHVNFDYFCREVPLARNISQPEKTGLDSKIQSAQSRTGNGHNQSFEKKTGFEFVK